MENEMSKRADFYIEREEDIPLNNQQSILNRQSTTNFEGFELRIEDLITYVPETKKQKEKVILKGISTNIKKGSFTAIVGPSGSGKTTLMNFLSGRQASSQMFHNYARYFLNGTEIENINDFKNIIGYVVQDDIMDDNFTPRELFKFYYDLRWNKGDSTEKRKRESAIKVQEMIELLGLEQCADTIVGNSYKRGISGGEKKRVNIGIELIQNPNLLFLDEPTTGLDSSNALHVMQVVQRLKQKGITIISTIHSPSAKIIDLFDQLLVLVDGYLIYDGNPLQISSIFKVLNQYPSPKEPDQEFFMKIIDKDDMRLQVLNEKGEKNVTTKEQIEEFEKEVNERYDKKIMQLVELQNDKIKTAHQNEWVNTQSI